MTRYGKPKGQRWSDWSDSCALIVAAPAAFVAAVMFHVAHRLLRRG